MAWRRKKSKETETTEGEGFDAVHAAEELDEVLGQAEVEGQTAIGADEYIQTLEAEIEGLHNLLSQKEALLAKAEKNADEHLEEIERVKKRLAAEARLDIEKGVAKVIVELLDVEDDLGRAISAAKEMDHNPQVVSGIELVRQSFESRLQKLGVSRVAALGEQFDPELHLAVSMAPVGSAEEDGMILAVAQEGFMMNGRLIREPKVVVGKYQGQS